MNREGIGAVVLALVAILAVAFVSATLTDVVEPEADGGSGGISGDGSGSPGRETTAPGESQDRDGAEVSREPLITGEGGSGGYCVKELQSTWTRLLIVLGLVGFFVFVKVRLDTLSALGIVGGSIPVLVLLYGFLTCGGFAKPPEATEPVGNGTDPSGTVGSGSQNPVVEAVPDAPVWLFVLAGVLAVAVAVIAVGSRGTMGEIVGSVWTADDDADDTESARMSDVAAMGRVAGRAADRIETGADAENEVYRAWQTMTEYLEVDRPESSTPAEFAAAAVDLGFDPDAVTALTEEFEAVRYGGQTATEDRERRAVEALRRIEADAEERDASGPGESGGDRR